MTSRRAIHTSKAYWELRAEQVLDRVFSGHGNSAGDNSGHDVVSSRPKASLLWPHDPEPPIEVEVRDASDQRSDHRSDRQSALHSDPQATPQGPAQTEPAAKHHPRSATAAAAVSRLPKHAGLVIAALFTGVACLSSVGLWHSWNQAQQDLRQERNLRLLEGIRSLAAAPAASNPSPPAGTAAGEGLPPPPPTEPWIEDLGQLGGPGSGLAPLQVPLSGTLRAPAPPASPATAGAAVVGSDGVPQLLGVVQIPGRPGSAIFQLGGSSSNALVGEAIGSSGWRLVSTSGNGVVIERGGVSRRVSISSGF